MATKPKKRDDRLFNPHGLKHFRRRHSWAELRWGLVLLCVMIGIASWVVYRGAHPEPGLFGDGVGLLAKSKIRVVVRPTKRLQVGNLRAPRRRPHTLRHPLLPTSIAGDGWRRRKITRFSKQNLYEKINGRAGYFKSFGFRMLYFTTIAHQKTRQLIDLELYDMGSAPNALGAYAGELSAKATPEVDPRGISHIARNAMFLGRGRYYLRAIGSDEKPIVVKKLRSLRDFFRKLIKGKPMPWAYGLLIAHVGVKASAISYDRENAFSFGFAKDVYKAKFSGNAYMFLCAQASETQAKTIAGKFRAGFASYGSEQKGADGTVWIKDRYINTFATAVAVERWVVGIQGAPSQKVAAPVLAKLKGAIKAMSPALRKHALPVTQRKAPRKAPARMSPEEGLYAPRRRATTPREGYAPREGAPPKEGSVPREGALPPRVRPQVAPRRRAPASRPVQRAGRTAPPQRRPKPRTARPSPPVREGGIDER